MYGTTTKIKILNLNFLGNKLTVLNIAFLTVTLPFCHEFKY